jgi:hypothetical protein
MQTIAVPAARHGVVCVSCGKPIPLSDSLICRVRTGQQDEASVDTQLYSRVFTVRCRSCRKESVYTLEQIIDFGE